ncbi:MAG: hypothetical protein KDD89_09795, partial [Anaerolineales bacterium]|nr:hypothetical protein [Anaerolineales bacterium]
MPALPPDLQQEVVTFCRPIFLEPDHRLTRLQAVCGVWDGVYNLILNGSAQTVTTEVVRQLPTELLTHLVQSRQVELGGREAEIAALCQRIAQADLTLSTGNPTPFTVLYRHIIDKWSRPEYQVDRRFVQLTLLLDQGPDAPQRFVPDSQHNRYDALHTLLDDHPRERAFILLGAPGSGKTTLLRRLALELSWTALGDHTPERQTDETAPPAPPMIPFFVMLNSYRSADPDKPPPPPATWLAERWATSHPDLPPLSEVVQ